MALCSGGLFSTVARNTENGTENAFCLNILGEASSSCSVCSAPFAHTREAHRARVPSRRWIRPEHREHVAKSLTTKHKDRDRAQHGLGTLGTTPDPKAQAIRALILLAANGSGRADGRGIESARRSWRGLKRRKSKRKADAPDRLRRSCRLA